MRPVSNLSKQLKSLRLSLNYSQRTFGKKVGVSSKAISAYETGRSHPSLKVLEKIAQVYKVTFLKMDDKQSTEIDSKMYQIQESLQELKRLLDKGLSL